MKHNAKKILAMLLSFVLVLSLVPAAAAVSITERDINNLMDKMDNLANEKINAEDFAAVEELYDAMDDLGDAYYHANHTVTDDVEAAYYSALAVYQKYTATVAVTGVSIDPGSFRTLTVGEVVTVKAEVFPDSATNKNVIWSVNGTGVTLYEDKDCTTTVILEHSTSLLTVYAKATAVGSGAVIVNSSQEGITPSTFNFEVKAAAYTVTYQPGEGSGKMEPTKVEKNTEGKFMYKAESCGFTAPDGKSFDLWKDSDGKEYKVGGEYELTGDLTLTAQWKDEEKPDDDSGSGKKIEITGDIVFIGGGFGGDDTGWDYVGGGYAPQQAYRVSLAPMQGGSAALGLTTGESTETAMNVYPSSTVYVFPNAEQGYVLDKIVWSLIDGSASYDITEAKNFVMPAMDAVVYVTFRPVG